MYQLKLPVSTCYYPLSPANTHAKSKARNTVWHDRYAGDDRPVCLMTEPGESNLTHDILDINCCEVGVEATSDDSTENARNKQNSLS